MGPASFSENMYVFYLIMFRFLKVELVLLVFVFNYISMKERSLPYNYQVPNHLKY